MADVVPAPAATATLSSTCAVLLAKARGCRSAYVSLILRRPCLVFWLFLATALLISVAIVLNSLVAFTFYGEYELYSEGHRYIRRGDMTNDAMRQRDAPLVRPDDEASASYFYSIVIYYEWLDDADLEAERSMFEPRALQQMCEIENLVLGASDYALVCPKSAAGGSTDAAGGYCSPQSTSPVSFFYSADDAPFAAVGIPGAPVGVWVESAHTRLCPLLDDTYVRLRSDQLLAWARESPALEVALRGTMEAARWSSNYTRRTRSFFSFRAPVGGYALGDDASAQYEARLDVYDAMVRRFHDHFGMNARFGRSVWRNSAHTDLLNILWTSPIESAAVPSLRPACPVLAVPPMTLCGVPHAADAREVPAALNGDLIFIVLSIAVVLAAMQLHMRSPLLAAMGMVQILVSLPLGIFIYRVVLRIPYFGQLSAFTAFLVLGVGADDLFVFFDAFKLFGVTALAPFERLESTLIRSSVSIFCTSFTTCFAFLALATSPLLPIASFGIFSAVCIFVDYVLTLTLWPPVVVIWQTHIVEPRRCVCRCCCRGDPAEAAAQRQDKPADEARNKGADAASAKAASVAAVPDEAGADSSADLSGASAAPVSASTSAPRGLHLHFRRWLGGALAHRVRSQSRLKPVSTVLVVGLLTITCVLASRAALLTYPTDVPQHLPSDHMTSVLAPRFGKLYVASSDSSYANGLVALGMAGLSRPRFSRWAPNAARGDVQWDDSLDLSSAEQQAALLEFVAWMRASEVVADLAFASSITCFLDAWAAELGSADALPTGSEFTPALLSWLQTPTGAAHAASAGVVDGQLRYATVEFRSKTNPTHDTPVKIINDAEAWDALLAERLTMSGVPEPFAGGFAFLSRTSLDLVKGEEIWSPTFGVNIMYETAERSMLQGVAASICLALVVVSVVTRSWRVGLFGTIAVASIVACQLGAVQLAGWSFGLAETVAATLVIGFSVDYTLHLGVAYSESGGGTREERVADAAGVMGPTVLGSAVTTLSSALPMFLCQLALLNKMGTLIAATVVGSFTFSLLFFLPLNALIGPDGPPATQPEEPAPARGGGGEAPPCRSTVRRRSDSLRHEALVVKDKPLLQLDKDKMSSPSLKI